MTELRLHLGLLDPQTSAPLDASATGPALLRIEAVPPGMTKPFTFKTPLSPADMSALIAARDTFQIGTFDNARCEAAAAVIRPPFERVLSAVPSPVTILSLETNQPWLLSQIPWELCQYAQSDLGRPLLRRVTGCGNAPEIKGRPLAMIALAQVRNDFGAIAKPQNFRVGIQQALRSTAPILVAERIGTRDDDYLSYVTFLTALKDTLPDVLILVAHGSSRPESTIFFQDPNDLTQLEPVAISQLVADLDGLRKPVLGVFLCCDISGGKVFNRDAGSALVGVGIHEVVCMQGQIAQDAAETFVKDLLLNLQRRDGIAEAVLAARRTVARSSAGIWQAMLPCLFTADGAGASRQLWQDRREAYRAALAALRNPPTRRFPWKETARRQQAVADICESKGLALVAGMLDPNGISLEAPFTDAAARQGLAVEDCAAPPILAIAAGGHFDGQATGTVWRELSARILAEFERAAQLLARPVEYSYHLIDPRSAAVEIAIAVQDADFVLVLLGPDAPGDDAAPDAAFWTELARQIGLDGEAGRIIVVPHSRDIKRFGELFSSNYRVHSLPGLSIQDIDDVMRSRPTDPRSIDATLNGARLAGLTGGNPYLVKLALNHVEARREGDLERLLERAEESVSETALDFFLPRLGEDDTYAFYAIARLKGGAGREVLEQVFFAHGAEMLQAALDIGLLVELETERNELRMGRGMAQRLRARIEVEYPDAAAEAAWIAYDLFDTEKLRLNDVARLYGGSVVLQAVQALAIDTWHTEPAEDELRSWAGRLAVRLKELDDGARPLAPRRPLIEVFRQSTALAREVGKDFPDGLLWAAQAAHSEGDTSLAQSLLNELYAGSPKSERPRSEVQLSAAIKQAEIAKDIAQHEAAAKIVADMTAVISEANDLTDQEAVRNISLSARYVRLKTRLFLLKESRSATIEDGKLLLSSERFRQRTLAALIERELKDDTPDWEQLTEWRESLEAELDAWIDRKDHARDAAFCYYQLAHSYRRGSRPDLKLAKAYYQASADAACAVEHERFAMALTRLLEVLRAEGGVEDDLNAAKSRLEDALRAIERGDFGTAIQSSWSARALVRGHRELADVADAEKSTFARQHHLMMAIDASGSPKLTSQRDSEMFRKVLLAYLDQAPSEGRGYRRLLGYLRKLAPILETRFSPDLRIDDPNILRTQLLNLL